MLAMNACTRPTQHSQDQTLLVNDNAQQLGRPQHHKKSDSSRSQDTGFHSWEFCSWLLEAAPSLLLTPTRQNRRWQSVCQGLANPKGWLWS